MNKSSQERKARLKVEQAKIKLVAAIRNLRNAQAFLKAVKEKKRGSK